MEPGVSKLELREAIDASEDGQDEKLSATLKDFRDDVRRDIRLYVGLGVMGGNAIAGFVMARWGPSGAYNSAARAVRTLLPL